MSSLNLSIKGKTGERVPVSDCKLEPLNLLIPGNSSILVPKHKVWPGQKKKETIKLQVPLPAEDSYDAEEEDDLEEHPAAKLKSRKVIQAANARTERKRSDSCKKKKQNAKKTVKANSEVCDRKKLAQHIKEQEDYMAELKAKYARKKKIGAKARDEIEPAASTSDDDNDGGSAVQATTTDGNTSSGAEATDTSDKVRSMLEGFRVKIKAAGTDGIDGDAFTPSEDAQILARHENKESFATIAGFMKRTRKQIAQRHRQLVEAGKTAETAGQDTDNSNNNGGGAATDVATAGETMDADADDSGVEKRKEKKKNSQVAEGDFGGLFDLGGLTKVLKAVAAEQAEMGDEAKRSEKDKNKKKDSPTTKSDKTSKKGKGQDDTSSGDVAKGRKNSQSKTGGESGYESDSEAVPNDAGALLYMNQYARQLLRDKDRIPAADDKFDEDDCVLLALAERRHESDRWEHIQARFANLTGRMVPIEILKYKLAGGKKPEDY